MMGSRPLSRGCFGPHQQVQQRSDQGQEAEEARRGLVLETARLWAGVSRGEVNRSHGCAVHALKGQGALATGSEVTP